MKTALVAALVAFLSLSPAHAGSLAIQPVPDRASERELVLERLTDAQAQLESWNVPGARARLDRLATDLSNDTTPFNKAVRTRTQEIVAKLDASDLRTAESKLSSLVKAVRDGVMPTFADLGDTATL